MTRMLALLALGLAGCHAGAAASAAASSAPTPDALAARPWQLSTATDAGGHRIDALFAGSKQPLELVFEGHHLSVRHTCNAVGGDYRLADGRLQLHGLLHTMMACADAALNVQDRAIRSRLRSQPRLELRDVGGNPQLRLLTDGGDILVFAGLRDKDSGPP